MRPHPVRLSGWKPDLAAHVRLAAGARLFYLGSADYLAIAGGRTNDAEAPTLADVLSEEATRKYEIPLERIVLEERSVETTENAEFTLQALKERDVSRVIVVTTQDHLARTMVSARRHGKRLGIATEGYAAEDVLAKGYGHDAHPEEILTIGHRRVAFSQTYAVEEAPKGSRYAEFAQAYASRPVPATARALNAALYGLTLMPGGERILRTIIHQRLKNEPTSAARA